MSIVIDNVFYDGVCDLLVPLERDPEERLGRRNHHKTTCSSAGTTADRAAAAAGGYHLSMTTTPHDPDPDATDPVVPHGDPGESPIPGEKQTPGADEDDPEYEHESPRRVHGGEPT